MHERISKLIQELKIKKVEFATAIGVSQPFVSELCSGAKLPSDRTISDICRVYHVNESWLRTGEGDMFLDLPPDKELDDIFAQIKMSDGNTIKAIIRAYWKLPDVHKAVIRQLIDDIAEQQKNGQG